MNARLEYKLAYRHYRATQGRSGLNVNLKSVSNAWKTYRDNILLPNSTLDPISIDYRNNYSLDYAKNKIRMLYHFATDFTLSKACNWSKQYQMLLASQALVNAAADWRDSIASVWLQTSFSNPGFGKINRQYHQANQYLSDTLDWQAQYQKIGL